MLEEYPIGLLNSTTKYGTVAQWLEQAVATTKRSTPGRRFDSSPFHNARSEINW